MRRNSSSSRAEALTPALWQCTVLHEDRGRAAISNTEGIGPKNEKGGQECPPFLLSLPPPALLRSHRTDAGNFGKFRYGKSVCKMVAEHADVPRSAHANRAACQRSQREWPRMRYAPSHCPSSHRTDAGNFGKFRYGTKNRAPPSPAPRRPLSRHRHLSPRPRRRGRGSRDRSSLPDPRTKPRPPSRFLQS
jgi:hypothetical protein